jgi:hypothetical protein
MSANDYARARDIARYLMQPDKANLTLRQAVVVGIEMGSISIIMNDETFPIGGINFLNSYHPIVGDVVWLMKNGADMLVIGPVVIPGGVTQEDRHHVGQTDYGEPAFMNSWQNYGNDGTYTYDDVTFYKDPDGFVHLEGVIKNTSGSAYNTLMFTLPVGYRPDYIVRIPIIANGGTLISKLWVMEIQPDGDVVAATANNPGSGTTLVKNYLSFEGVKFMAAEDVAYERIQEWTPFGRLGDWVWDFSSQNLIPPGQWHRWDGLVRVRGRFSNAVDPTQNQVARISERSARMRWNKLFPSVMVDSAGEFEPVRIDVQPFGRELARVTSAFDNELLVDGLQWFADIPESYWTELPLSNSWVNYTSFPYWGPPAYFKDGYGVVHVRGLVTAGSTALDSVVGTLPVDCRPIQRKMFPSWHGGVAPGRLDVHTDGTIRIGMGSMNNNHLTLDPISFRANEDYTF